MGACGWAAVKEKPQKGPPTPSVPLGAIQEQSCRSLKPVRHTLETRPPGPCHRWIRTGEIGPQAMIGKALLFSETYARTRPFPVTGYRQPVQTGAADRKSTRLNSSHRC